MRAAAHPPLPNRQPVAPGDALAMLIKSGDFARLLPQLSAPLIRQSQKERLGLVHAAMQVQEPGQRKRVLGVLVDLGADVSAHNAERTSPLHEAVERVDLEGMALLISFGADVNAQNASGQTPLHVTAQRGRVRPAVRLISAGANVGVRDDAGKTFLDLANESFVEHIELLMDVRKTIRLLDTKMGAAQATRPARESPHAACRTVREENPDGFFAGE